MVINYIQKLLILPTQFVNILNLKLFRNNYITILYYMEYEYLEKEELYKCFYCDYETHIVGRMKTHCKSKKHMFNMGTKNVEDVKTELGLACEYCQKTFNTLRLVKKHQYRSCKILKKQQEEFEKKQEMAKELSEAHEVIHKLTLEKLDKEKKEIEEGKIPIIPQPHTINNNTVNNNVVVNQHFNLQVYLNEDCKDAIDIGEFTKSIKITMDDLMYIGNNGWSDGMTKLIVDNLNKLDVDKRPIQCSDAKRDVTYIKDGDWKKDKEHDLMEKTIKELNKEQYKAVGTWTKEKYPIAGTNAADDLHRVLSNLSPGQEPEKKINKVKRNIRNATAIDKTK